MSVAVDIVVESEGWADEEGLARLVEPALAVAARAAAADRGRPFGEVGMALAFADDDRVRALNRDFRGKDKPTNVLSFPAPPEASAPGGPAFLGDVVLARETVAREAAETGIPHDAHLVHLAVHGFLHLLGYDHEIDADAERMEHLETAILAELGLPDPHAPLDASGNVATPHRRPAPG